MFFRRRAKPRIKVGIAPRFLDFEPKILCDSLKKEVWAWLGKNIENSNWTLWDREGDIYGLKFTNPKDAMHFKLIFG